MSQAQLTEEHTVHAQLEGIDISVGSPNVNFPSIDRHQIVHLLTQIPGVYNKIAAGEDLTEDAAMTLANLTQQAAFANAFPDPGPSSHPFGPPNPAQFNSLVARTVSPAAVSPQSNDDEGEEGGKRSSTAPSTGGRRRGGDPAAGTEEWTKKRKENHKEVERRRRENINEGIDELGRIVPDSGGEKSKGATLSRAVQYIHHLQENEVRNIEKWTLEKLLMDQAMGDLQAQLEEMRKLWEQEHYARQRAEQELEAAKGLGTKRPNEDGNEMKQEPTE